MIIIDYGNERKIKLQSQKQTLEKNIWYFQITLSEINWFDFVPKMFLKKKNWPEGWSLAATTGKTATAYSRWMHQHVACNDEFSNESILETCGER